MDLIQTLVGLPLRTPPGYGPYDKDAQEKKHNQLKPFRVGKEIGEDADKIWEWSLEALANELPRETGKLILEDLVGHRRIILALARKRN